MNKYEKDEQELEVTNDDKFYRRRDSRGHESFRGRGK
jgi:hypothetical protein